MVSANAKGALLMSAGRIAFVTNDALMKFLFADMSVFQAMFLRGMLAVPLIGPLLGFKTVCRPALVRLILAYCWSVVPPRLAWQLVFYRRYHTCRSLMLLLLCRRCR